MNDLLLGLGLGVGLIVGGSLLLFRFSRLSVVAIALTMALLALALYLPLAALNWPGGDVLAIHLAVYLLSAFACGVFLRERQQHRREQGLHWGPLAIIGFFIGVVVLSVFFIVVAERGLAPSLNAYLFSSTARQGTVSSRFPGVISHDFQEKEELYNQYLQQVQRQQERGWQIQKGWLGKPVAGTPTVFKVVVHTREGEPLTGATVDGQFLRPADSRLDTTFTLPEVEPGVYQVSLSLPAVGLWDLILHIRKGEELHEIRATTEVVAP
ncbi:MAG TPA: FixH family protein [Candidatus Competibacteraceae bacterium]|nr:FixH family protein [Candidatus Competibacteraceae bacterium]